MGIGQDLPLCVIAATDLLMKTTQLITVIPKNPREINGETITHTLLFLSSNSRCTSLKVGTKSARF
jgi:hypothetical protein